MNMCSIISSMINKYGLVGVFSHIFHMILLCAHMIGVYIIDLFIFHLCMDSRGFPSYIFVYIYHF